MTEVVFDASAIIAVLRRNTGNNAASPYLRGGRHPAVNLSEVIVKAAGIRIDLFGDAAKMGRNRASV